MQLQGRSLLSLSDFTADEIGSLLDLSSRVKRERQDGRRTQRLSGYTLAMIFEKQSTRTRSAFETAFGEEGGYPVFLGTQDIHLGTKESVEDSARVLGGMFDLLAFRGFKQSTVQTLADYSGIPVINALTDDNHPTQVLADLLTVQECFGGLQGRKLCYVGDGTNNVARSLVIGCAKMGVHLSIAAPASFQPDPIIVNESLPLFAATGSSLTVTDSIEAALANADAVYTDVWVSMGQESSASERESILLPYQVNEAAMRSTGRPDSIFLHCLPAIKGKEVSEAVFEGPQSRVWQQAANRKHTIKAAILALLGLS